MPLHGIVCDEVHKVPSPKAFLHFPFGDFGEDPLEIGNEGKVALPL